MCRLVSPDLASGSERPQRRNEMCVGVFLTLNFHFLSFVSRVPPTSLAAKGYRDGDRKTNTCAGEGGGGAVCERGWRGEEGAGSGYNGAQ